MAKTNTADGTFSKQESGGKNQENETYGGYPADPNVQEWPSYSGKPKEGAGMGNSKSGGMKKSGY